MSQNSDSQQSKGQTKGNSSGNNQSSQSQQQQARPSSQFSAQDLNRIVLEYLNKKGYHKTEAMLRAESGRTLTPQDKDSLKTNKNAKIPEPSKKPPGSDKNAKPVSNPPGMTGTKRDAEGGIVSKQMETLNAPENYIRAYSLLKNWVDSSLELYKNELNYIMYPIFIYMFLNLVKRDVIQARRFFDKYSTDFKLYHSTEINRLFSVNSMDHIKENEIASAFNDNRYRITVSRSVFSLLLYFLSENESVGGSLIISIINQYLEPNIVNTVHSKAKLGDGIKNLKNKDSIKGIDSNVNSVPVKLGPFPRDEEFVKEVETELKIRDDQEKQQLEQSKGDQPTGHEQNNDLSVANKDIQHSTTLLNEYKALNHELTSDSKETSSKPNDKDKNDDSITKDLDSKSPLGVNNVLKADYKLEIPSRETIPLPPKTSLDIKLEIQKVKESRDAIRLDNLQVAMPTVCMYTFHNTNRGMTSLEFSDDSRLVAAGFQDSFIKIWSLDGTSLISNRIPSTKRKEMELNDPATSMLIGHSGAVYSTSFSPDNRFLLSGSEDKTVRLWSLDTHTALVSYKGHNHPVWDVKFSPLGHYFATASHDQTARLWSSDHIYPLRIFAGHLSDVDSVTFHPNGCYVFTGSSDKTCRMWDINSGDSVRLFLGHTAPVLSTAVTPDGRWLCSGSEDGIINVWDIGTGKRLKQMRGHGKNAINSLTFNKEGNVLISGGADHTVRVWDLKKATNEPSLEPEEPFVGYIGDVTASVNQDIKEYGRRRTIIPTNDLVASFYTKRTPVFKVKFTRNNIALAGGAFRDV
ncbi:Transcription initiation factor TFIID subunit 5 [Monosporozyma unispora]|nr:Transcription initiation factor TFIID subunit 5 [Kazachstania unispora]